MGEQEGKLGISAKTYEKSRSLNIVSPEETDPYFLMLYLHLQIYCISWKFKLKCIEIVNLSDFISLFPCACIFIEHYI